MAKHNYWEDDTPPDVAREINKWLQENTGAVYTTYDDYNAAYDAYEADIAATYDAYDDAYITYRKELKKTKKEITNA
jgi:hypothetical protein